MPADVKPETRKLTGLARARARAAEARTAKISVPHEVEETYNVKLKRGPSKERLAAMSEFEGGPALQRLSNKALEARLRTPEALNSPEAAMAADMERILARLDEGIPKLNRDLDELLIKVHLRPAA